MKLVVSHEGVSKLTVEVDEHESDTGSCSLRKLCMLDLVWKAAGARADRWPLKDKAAGLGLDLTDFRLVEEDQGPANYSRISP